LQNLTGFFFYNPAASGRQSKGFIRRRRSRHGDDKESPARASSVWTSAGLRMAGRSEPRLADQPSLVYT